MLELPRVIRNMATSVLPDNEHLPKMSFRLGVTLESVGVPALFLADLAVPPQPLKSFGLHLIGEVLGCSNCEVS